MKRFTSGRLGEFVISVIVKTSSPLYPHVLIVALTLNSAPGATS